MFDSSLTRAEVEVPTLRFQFEIQKSNIIAPPWSRDYLEEDGLPFRPLKKTIRRSVGAAALAFEHLRRENIQKQSGDARSSGKATADELQNYKPEFRPSRNSFLPFMTTKVI